MSQEYQKRKLVGCFQSWLGVGQVMVPMCSLHFPLVSWEGTPGFLKDKFFSSHSQTLHQSAPWKWGQLFCGGTSNSVVLYQRLFCLTGVTWVTVYGHFWLSWLGTDTTGLQWVETKDAAGHPTMYKAGPYNTAVIGLASTHVTLLVYMELVVT